MSQGPDILREILAHKHDEVTARKAATPLPEMKRRALASAAPLGFYAAIRRALEAGRPAVIAEIKRASPSRGVIRQDFDPSRIAESYARGSAKRA